MAGVTSLKGIGEKDGQMIEGVEALFGPEPSTTGFAEALVQLVREHSHHFKLAARKYGEKIVDYQAVQAGGAPNQAQPRRGDGQRRRCDAVRR